MENNSFRIREIRCSKITFRSSIRFLGFGEDRLLEGQLRRESRPVIAVVLHSDALPLGVQQEDVLHRRASLLHQTKVQPSKQIEAPPFADPIALAAKREKKKGSWIWGHGREENEVARHRHKRLDLGAMDRGRSRDPQRHPWAVEREGTEQDEGGRCDGTTYHRRRRKDSRRGAEDGGRDSGQPAVAQREMGKTASGRKRRRVDETK